MKPAVSVIIPVFNGEKYLGEAVDSVLSQTDACLEVIIVDDGSTDGTSRIAQTFGPSIRYLYQENAGTVVARNKGIEVANGDFFAFLDADDLWMENKVELQMKALIVNPQVEAVFGHVKQFFSPELDEEAKKRLFCPEEPVPGGLPSTMLIRREAFYRVGLFESQWQVGGDVEWILRAWDKGLRTMILPDLIYMRRLHKNNKGITHRPFILDRVKILKAHLDAKRKKGENS